MENEKDQPARKCDQAAWNSNEHEPTHHTELVKKLAIIVPVDDARMDGAFIHFAPVRIGDPGAQYY